MLRHYRGWTTIFVWKEWCFFTPAGHDGSQADNAGSTGGDILFRTFLLTDNGSDFHKYNFPDVSFLKTIYEIHINAVFRLFPCNI